MKKCILSLATLVATCLAGNAQDNHLSPREKADGWQLLFDGKTTRGWMSPKRKPLPESHARDGTQANPASTRTMRKFGKRSNTPSITIDVRKVWQDCAWPTMSSI